MDAFDKAVEFALDWETAWGRVIYTNDPDDPGGETAWGISRRAHPFVDIKNLTKEGAVHIYREEYWKTGGVQQACCDKLPSPVSWVHFDTTVNLGNYDSLRQYHGTANKLLQRALGVVADGVVGPKTLAAAASADSRRLAACVLVERQKRYRAIVKQRESSLKYLDGWFNRCEDLLLRAVVG